jgi:polyisoprenoid-binding protein YceI
MRQFFKSMAVATGVILLVGCGGKAEQTTETDNNVTYSYAHENSVMEWTAFKFLSKAPVKGTFNNIIVSSISEAKNVKTLAESFGFTIPVNSIETQDESRNAKIVQFFFGTISTEELTGRIVKLADDGTAELEVTMNGITDIVSGKYEITDNYFSFKATMDIAKWNTDKAISVLNENCKENHTENGVTKVWSEVDLEFTTKVVENKK